MNLKNLIKSIEKTDAEVCSKHSDRRQALLNFGSTMASATLPFSVSSIFKKPFGKTTVSVMESLKLALELEYLEYSFYHTANNAPGLIPASDAAGFKTIEAHEKSQIDFFVKAITDLGGIASSGSDYDFTVGGVYPVFSDYSTFLMTAQAIEDAGMRAHISLLETLAGHPLYAQVQQIATTEARHAAHSRLLRREMHVENVPAEYLVNNFAFQNLKNKSIHSGRNMHPHVGMG